MSAYDRSPRTPWRPLWATVLAAGLAASGCSSNKPPDAIQIPAVASLRSASDILIEKVETDDEAPKWLDRDRVTDRFVYGIGIQSGGRNDSEDLFLAMHAARRTIVVWLESRGTGTGAAEGLLPSLRIDPERIEFERLAHNDDTDRWYALARLDVPRETAAIETAVSALELTSTASNGDVLDPSASEDTRVRAALSILYDLDRIEQYGTLYHALTTKALPPSAGFDPVALRASANALLAQHGVRVIVDGPFVPGLYEAVSVAMGEVHLMVDEFGPGLVAVQLVESGGFGPGNPYLEIDGTVQLEIGGGSSRSYGQPFHVVSTGNSVEEARFRAARSINQEVARIVRETLRQIGGSGT